MERKNKKKPDWPLFHSHPAGRRPRTVRFNITRRKIRPLSVWTWPRGVFPSAYSVASVYNRRTCNSVRRVTCVTLPWPIPGLVSAAQRKESTTGLRDASPRDREKKKKKKTSTRHSGEEPRADRVVSYCKLELFPAAATVSEAVHTPLRSLWMRGWFVSAPLRTAHSSAGSAPI